eukprot:GHVT01060081.1.p1 GENE.GHVT01060081.1~~GHVT01060081.1.p1  ORF type:complete len:271 (+),score=35.32 GHVT01060081.1:713-1525(+)
MMLRCLLTLSLGLVGNACLLLAAQPDAPWLTVTPRNMSRSSVAPGNRPEPKNLSFGVPPRQQPTPEQNMVCKLPGTLLSDVQPRGHKTTQPPDRCYLPKLPTVTLSLFSLHCFIPCLSFERESFLNDLQTDPSVARAVRLTNLGAPLNVLVGRGSATGAATEAVTDLIVSFAMIIFVFWTLDADAEIKLVTSLTGFVAAASAAATAVLAALYLAQAAQVACSLGRNLSKVLPGTDLWIETHVDVRTNAKPDLLKQLQLLHRNFYSFTSTA